MRIITRGGQSYDQVYVGFCKENAATSVPTNLSAAPPTANLFPCNLPGNGYNSGGCACVCPDSCPLAATPAATTTSPSAYGSVAIPSPGQRALYLLQ